MEAAVQRTPLQREDLVQPLLDVLEYGVQVVAVQRLAALLAELLEEVAQPLHALPQRVAQAALEQVAQRVLEVAEVHEIVREPGEDVVRVKRPDLLRAVPFGVAEAERHGRVSSGPLYGMASGAREEYLSF